MGGKRRLIMHKSERILMKGRLVRKNKKDSDIEDKKGRQTEGVNRRLTI